MQDDHSHPPTNQPPPSPPSAWPPFPADIPIARPATLAYPAGYAAHHPLLPPLTKKQAWKDIFLFIVIAFLMIFGADVVIGMVTSVFIAPPDNRPDLIHDDAFFDASFDAATSTLLLPIMILRVVLVILACKIVLNIRSRPWHELNLNLRQWPIDLLLGIPTLMITSGTVMITMLTLHTLFPDFMAEKAGENLEKMSAMIPALPIASYALLFLCVAVWEELAFRGFLMSRLRVATGSSVAAVLLNTLLFVPPHVMDQAPIAMIPITLMSLSFSIVTVMRGSLLPAIVAHFSWDFFIVIMLQLSQETP